jgi:rhodanese-related sulfurtransferase
MAAEAYALEAHCPVPVEGGDTTPLAITTATAVELIRLGLACLIDIRQPFELEVKGRLPHASHIPFFEVKRGFGFNLTEEEQEILDADEPTNLDIRAFIKAINALRRSGECIFLVTCNSGKRSLCATRLLRELGYPRSFSVEGGYLALEPRLS